MNPKYIQVFFAVFILTGTSFSALCGKDSETLEGMQVDGLKYKELDLSRATVLSGSDIESRRTSSISGLSALSPNLYINSYGIQSYGDVITLRGIGNSQLFGDPAVGLYVDGIPQGSTATYSNTLFEVESIEVLKGYHGHQFGKNSPGGVINVSTRKAGDTHRSKLYASYGSFNTQSYRVLADGPTGEYSSYYFGLNRSESDGYVDNLNTTGNDATSESWNGRLGFNFTTSDGLEIGIGGSWEEFQLGAQPLVPRPSSNNPKYSSFYSRNSGIGEIGKISINSQYLTVRTGSDWGDIKSTTSRNFWELNPSLIDLNFADSGLAGLSLARPDLSSTSQIIEERETIWEEIQLSNGQVGEFSWLIGLSIGNEDVTGDSTRLVPLPSDRNESNYAGYQSYNSKTSYSFDNDKFAIHAKISNSISESASYELGLRYDHEKKQIRRGKSNEYHFFLPVDQTSMEHSYDWVTPFATMSKELNEQLTLSLSSSLSQKPGGFSAYVDEINGNSIFPISFTEERIWANELMINLFQQNDRLGASIAVFWNEIDDFQFEKPSGSFDYFVDNADEVEVKGLELNFFTHTGDNWLLQGAYGITDGEIKKHTGSSISGYDNLGQPILEFHDFSGKHVPSTPEQTVSLSVTNQFSDALSWTAGLTHVGKIHYLDQTAMDTINDSYTLWNASISYSASDWELSVFGTNLSDEEYYSSLVTSLTGTPGVAGSPRVIGLSISKEF
ncbi:MAG: TonB-dependent receptor [Opitutales bacterium]|nr:TonB-dependent receptor [Opitutales bacterium]